MLAQVKRCKAQAQLAAQRLEKVLPRWMVRPEAFADSPGWGVIRWAEGWDGLPRADLVVVGAAERSALGRILLGSVSYKVVTYCACSVRIARFTAHTVDRKLQLLIGVDGSPDAFSAVRAVCSRRWPTGTQVCVVCVVDSRMKMLNSAIQPQGTSAADEMAEAIAERGADELRRVGLTVSKHVTMGEPKQEILKQAEELGADCVFVGARGLSRVERILLGSVSTAVAMRALCSVEVVRFPAA